MIALVPLDLRLLLVPARLLRRSFFAAALARRPGLLGEAVLLLLVALVRSMWRSGQQADLTGLREGGRRSLIKALMRWYSLSAAKRAHRSTDHSLRWRRGCAGVETRRELRIDRRLLQLTCRAVTSPAEKRNSGLTQRECVVTTVLRASSPAALQQHARGYR